MKSKSTISALFLTIMSTICSAHSEDFYKGKTLTMIVGAPAGAIYDISARLFARHLSSQIPGNPTIVVQNMPGAAGMRAENYLYNVAPRDGTTIGISIDSILLNPFLAPDEVRYRSDKFSWIGRGDRATKVLYVWGKSDIHSIEDAKQRVVLTGITAPGSAAQLYASLANYLLGTKFKEIGGYEGAGGVNLALERGEIEAVGANAWTNIMMTKPQWIRDSMIRPLFQMAMERDPDLADVPTLLELCVNEEQRAVVRLMTKSEVGFYLLGPPDVPEDRTATLRHAFDAMLRSSDYRTDARNAQMGFNSATGPELQRLAGEIAATPPDVAEQFTKAAQSH